MKNKSILKRVLDKMLNNHKKEQIIIDKKIKAEELRKIDQYLVIEFKKIEMEKDLTQYHKDLEYQITDLNFVIREGKYYGYNIEDIIDIDPSYLMWMHNEEVFNLSGAIYFKVMDELEEYE